MCSLMSHNYDLGRKRRNKDDVRREEKGKIKGKYLTEASKTRCLTSAGDVVKLGTSFPLGECFLYVFRSNLGFSVRLNVSL